MLTISSSILLTACGDHAGSQLSSDSTAWPSPAGWPAIDGGPRRVATRLVADGTAAEFVIAPRIARVGEPVEVRVTTAGGCGVHEDATEVSVVGLLATITPYQRVQILPPDRACPALLPVELRHVRFTFATRGSARVHVVYRESGEDAVRTLELPIEVQ